VDLIGELVKLRAYRHEDAEPMQRNLSDPEVVRYLANWSWRPYGAADALDFLNRHDPSRILWAVECRADGAFIGGTGLHQLDFRNRNCHWGIWIGPPERWGKGYGTEACRLSVRFAFRQLGMEKVYLHVYEGNDRGRRAYEKAGFRVEGTLPRHTWLDGRLVTTYLMAVYRDDPTYA